MDEIAVGELVILQNAGHYEEWNGALGVVVGGLLRRRTVDLNTMTRNWIMCYRMQVLVEDGCVVNAEPHQMRRLRDPKDGGRQQAAEDPDATIV